MAPQSCQSGNCHLHSTKLILKGNSCHRETSQLLVGQETGKDGQGQKGSLSPAVAAVTAPERCCKPSPRLPLLVSDQEDRWSLASHSVMPPALPNVWDHLGCGEHRSSLSLSQMVFC
ncbi:SH3 domain-binding glutamic acid-rich-like protein 3 [Platysternon megacephalum]|uniref:SH3 domain-binding glutamic acid-rich-like protein 3 n=1 Tax=Platysternon megacephalum TaxID=55544 RepID=A0A4D9EKR1_9SAUR|nr:SH3 domain-binding glutamic acid-rich-like protein 3 [Platysternon megacephalum]